jgi:hypothetical protein
MFQEIRFRMGLGSGFTSPNRLRQGYEMEEMYPRRQSSGFRDQGSGIRVEGLEFGD